MVKQDIDERCLVCDKPVKAEHWLQKHPDTGMRGVHYVCEDGHVNKKRKYTPPNKEQRIG